MSYILDALKKTDQERQRGATPTLSSQPRKVPPQRPKGPARLLYLLLAVLLINAGVLCWWLKPWQHEPAESRPVTETEKKDQAASPPLAATAVSKGGESVKHSVLESHPQASVAKVPAIPRKELLGNDPQGKAKEVTPEKIIADKAITPAKGDVKQPRQEGKPESPATGSDQLAKSEAGRRRQQIVSGQAGNSASSVVTGSDVSGAVIQKDKGNGQASVPFKLVQPKETALQAEKGKQRSDNSAVKERQAVGQPPAEAPGVNEKVHVIGNVLLDYNQLPFSLRQKLPPLTISLHLYADKPERRMANIDGQMRHEKERIDQDLVIDEITPDGVIFDYAGRRFLKKVFR